jgi:hypothetical protein
VPTFCRHNRFIERCPICSKTLPGNEPGAGGSAVRPRSGPRAGAARSERARSRQREPALRVHREARSLDDGYRSELAPGLRASADALRLAEEIAFAGGRLEVLAEQPPGLYGDARALAREDLERATWTCFLIAYLCPLEDEEPFAGVRMALAAAPDPLAGATLELAGIPLGPRSSHEPSRGAETLRAYGEWTQRAAAAAGAAAAGAGPQAIAFGGDPVWSPERRFERVFERLALPGFARSARYEMLVTLGALGLYEMRADSLHLTAGARGVAGEDPTTLAAKRVFGIGDPLLLERRAASLAQAAAVPIEALDLALANWASPQPATLGVPRTSSDDDAFERAGAALGL